MIDASASVATTARSNIVASQALNRETEKEACPPSIRTFGFIELFQGQGGLTQAIEDICKDWVINHSNGTGDFSYANIADDAVFDRILQAIQARAFLWLHAAPPCKTFSPARRADQHGCARVLRSQARPEGFGAEATEVANKLASRTAALAQAMAEAGGYFSIENPLK